MASFQRKSTVNGNESFLHSHDNNQSQSHSHSHAPNG